MALAEKASHRDRRSVRTSPVFKTPEELAQENVPDAYDTVELAWDLAKERALEAASDRVELALNRRMDRERARLDSEQRELARKSQIVVEPTLGGLNDAELLALEERLTPPRRPKGNHEMDPTRGKGFTPQELFKWGIPLYSPGKRYGTVYNITAKVLTSRVLHDPKRFRSAHEGFNLSLTDLQRKNPDAFTGDCVVGNLAVLVHSLSPHYEGANVPVDVQRRFSRVVSDIQRYVPGLSHALNMIELQGSSHNGTSHEDLGSVVPSNGNGSHRLGYVNDPTRKQVPVFVVMSSAHNSVHAKPVSIKAARNDVVYGGLLALSSVPELRYDGVFGATLVTAKRR